jgi:hypothetical protein
MTDFGRTVIVCRMRHAQPHGNVAHECFGYERTLALLPLPDNPEHGHALCSVVVTAGAADAAALMALNAQAFAAQVQAQFAQRLGPMALEGERHAYPLVAVYADQFAAHRCALLGDLVDGPWLAAAAPVLNGMALLPSLQTTNHPGLLLSGGRGRDGWSTHGGGCARPGRAA